MRLTYLIIFSLFAVMLTGCADCEKDYDLAGVPLTDFSARTGISSILSQQCNTAVDNASCITNLNNPSTEFYNINQGFVVQCNNGQYKFDLQQTIRAHYPMESYKDKDDAFERCDNYWVFDFFSNIYKSEVPLAINSVKVNETNGNIWYVSIGGTCYEWNLANSIYAVDK